VSVISFDDLPETRRLVKDGVILATICQQPVRQGRMALSVLFDYFVEGKRPVTDHLYTDILIKVRANIDQ
jgi:LacI family transcriptional regulator